MPAKYVSGPSQDEPADQPQVLRDRLAAGCKILGAFPYEGASGREMFGRLLLQPPPPRDGAVPAPLEWLTVHSERGQWHEGVPILPGGRVLYRLPQLLAARAALPAYVTPDERAAKALADLGLNATTSGAGLPAARANWNALRRRLVRLWPGDGNSADWVAEIADLVWRYGCKVEVPPSFGHVTHPGVLSWLAAAPHSTAKDVEAQQWQSYPLRRQALRAIAATGQEPTPEPEAEFLTLRASEVEAESLQWLWPGRIALGKFTVIAGNPGMGKSLLSLALAAHVTRGTPWPVDATACPQGEVLLVTDEDGAADTIRPRLDAAGSNGARVHLLQSVARAGQGNRLLRLQKDLGALQTFLTAHPQVRMVCIDPLSLYLGQMDTRSDSAIRAILHPLGILAATANVAIIGIAHLNKRSAKTGSPLYRVSGSLALVAAARACYLVARDPNDRDRRLLLPAKNNLGQDSTGLAYKVVRDYHGRPMLEWEPDLVDVSAGEGWGAAPNSGQGEAANIADWLTALLGEGSLPARQVRQAATSAGLSWRAVLSSMRAANVESRRLGFGPKATYIWDLRTSPHPPAPPSV